MPTKKPEELFSVEPLIKKNIQLVPKSIGEKTYEIAKKVENKSDNKIVIQKMPEQVGPMKFQLKRQELLKRIQDQLDQIKEYRDTSLKRKPQGVVESESAIRSVEIFKQQKSEVMPGKVSAFKQVPIVMVQPSKDEMRQKLLKNIMILKQQNPS